MAKTEEGTWILCLLINAEKLPVFEFLQGTEYCNNYTSIFST